MARVTVEDCLENQGNRFALVVLAAKRARSLMKGASPLVASRNREAVTALREVSKGKVRFGSSVNEAVQNYIDEHKE